MLLLLVLLLVLLLALVLLHYQCLQVVQEVVLVSL